MSNAVSLYCAAALTVCAAAPAAAQDAGGPVEGPGDIVVTRDVPTRNALIPGEPGRPSLVNPKTIVISAVEPLTTMDPFADALGGQRFAPLSDSQAAAVFGSGGRAVSHALGTLDGIMPDPGMSSRQASSMGSGSGLGNTISGAVTGATSSLRDALGAAGFGSGG